MAAVIFVNHTSYLFRKCTFSISMCCSQNRAIFSMPLLETHKVYNISLSQLQRFSSMFKTLKPQSIWGKNNNKRNNSMLKKKREKKNPEPRQSLLGPLKKISKLVGLL